MFRCLEHRLNTLLRATCALYQHHAARYIRSFSEDASKTLVQAFVFCHLDYCNSLFFALVKLCSWILILCKF